MIQDWITKSTYIMHQSLSTIVRTGCSFFNKTPLHAIPGLAWDDEEC